MLSTGNNVLTFLVDTIFSLYITVLLGRIMLQVTRAPFSNPIAQFIWRITARPVRFVGMAIPRWRQIDTPAIILALILMALNIELDVLIVSGQFFTNPGLLIWVALIKTLLLLSNLYFFTILAEAILSWLSSMHASPAAAILRPFNEPLLKPLRRWIPNIAGLDLSPLVAIIALQAINIVLNQQLLYIAH